MPYNRISLSSCTTGGVTVASSCATIGHHERRVRRAENGGLGAVDGHGSTLSCPVSIPSRVFWLSRPRRLHRNGIDVQRYRRGSSRDLPAEIDGTGSRTWGTLSMIVREGEISIPDLTDESEQSKSTTTRHVTRLSESGVVDTWRERKTKYAAPTITGNLLVRANAGSKRRDE